MESATPMILFLVFLFGGLWLVLMMGYQSSQAQRREEEAEELPDVVNEVPRFFANYDDTEAPSATEVTEVLVRQVEAFLAEERDQARRFVRDPTLGGLSADPVRARTNGEVDRVRKFVDQEWVMARQFVAMPSVECLHRDGRRLVSRN